MKGTLKDIKNLINNQNFLIDEIEKGYPITPFMYVYKSNNQSYGSLDKLKLIIVVRVDLKNKENIGNAWDTTSSMRTLKYFLEDDTKHKSRVHQLNYIG